MTQWESQTSGPTIGYYHSDALGSVRSLTDEAGEEIKTYTYDAWGKMTSETGTSSASGNEYKFTSRRWEDEIGLQYNRARFYDPELGRFITRDPLTGGPDDPTISYFSGVYSQIHRFIKEYVDALQPDKLNRYVYAYNNPINFIDPLGLDVTNLTGEDLIVKVESHKDVGYDFVVVPNGETLANTDGVVTEDKIIKHNTGVDIKVYKNESGEITYKYSTRADQLKDWRDSIGKGILNKVLTEEKELELSGIYEKEDREKFLEKHGDWDYTTEDKKVVTWNEHKKLDQQKQQEGPTNEPETIHSLKNETENTEETASISEVKVEIE